MRGAEGAAREEPEEVPMKQGVAGKPAHVTAADHRTALWQALSGRRFAGFKFHRQEAIGPYTVDFVCHEKKLVVELDDGKQTALESLFKAHLRANHLKEDGFQVMHIKATAWHNDEGAVLDTILRARRGGGG
jgi:very-short-patch-repair endonuclease